MSTRTQYERVERVRGFNYIRLKTGALLSFWEAHTAVERAETSLTRALSRAFKLAVADDDSYKEELGGHYYLESVECLIERIESYLNHLKSEIEERRGMQSQEDRIALLRNVAGRTPEEAAEFLRKADELEERLKS